MAMQDVTLQAQDIVERVNDFVGEPAFTDVKTALLQGERHLTQ